VTSKLGWVIAGIIVVALGIAITWFIVYPRPTSATRATRDEVLKLHEVSVPVTAVLDREPSAGGNAADDYERAILIVKDERNWEAIIEAQGKADDMMTGTYVPDPTAMEAMKKIREHVSAGAKKKQMDYIFRYTPKTLEVAYDVEKIKGFDNIDGLQNVAGALNLLTKYYLGQKEWAEAVDLAKLQFTMGWHMMGERAMVDLVRRGMAIQDQALRDLEFLYGEMDGDHKGKIAKAKEYRFALQDIRDMFGTKLSVLVNQQPNPGDVFRIADEDEDRCWRVQAILLLGVLKFTAPGRGDTRVRKDLIARYLDSDDPLEAAAAKAADAFTEEDFSVVGRKLTLN